MEVKKALLTFTETNLRKADIPKFRGYLSKKYPKYDLIHNHLKNGKLRYSYPLIQFKAVNSHPTIIAINDGINILKEVFLDLGDIKIGEKKETIHEKSIILKKERFGISEEYIDYRFASLWMALNQENYKKYIKLNRYDQRTFLKHILRENLKTVSKGFNYRIPDIEKVKVDGDFRKREVNFKNLKMLCFTGKFITNFYIPDYLGIGKQVARGFGTVIKN